jgi:alpha-L-arabinofuranosidase
MKRLRAYFDGRIAGRFFATPLVVGFLLAHRWNCSGASTPSITVDVAHPGHAVPATLWGIFFEEINHAGDGGLYAEMVQNRDFEANTLEEGWRIDANRAFTPLGAHVDLWFTNNVPGWSYVGEGGADGEMAQETDHPLNDRNPHSLRLTARTLGTRCGIINSGYWGMNVRADAWYDLSFHARTENGQRLALVVSLESEDGKKICARATIPEISGNWRPYGLALHARESDPRAHLVIEMVEPGSMWLDTVSLFPRETFKNRPNGMRPDLAQMLADLHPGFLRFPGGCVVEGITVQNGFRWKDSIGDISQRRGGFDVWGYYNTYGLGFQEYMQLAQDIGAKLLYVINVGMSCQARTRQPAEVTSDADLGAQVQESMDALEYAMGGTNTDWGAKRAANGHADPFPIDYVEIGNENNGPNYGKHYPVFYQTIKAKYPGIVAIADAPPRNQTMQANPVECRDDHFYVDPARFFGMAHYYDNADRKGPKIYVGEYAVNRGVGTGNLMGALAEAVFMMNLERNSDVVLMASYAPLFENVNRRDWPVNLILYDSSRVVGRSSYQVQKMFSDGRPDVVLPTDVQAPQIPFNVGQTNQTNINQLYALGGFDRKASQVILKVVNPTSAEVSANITLNGVSKFSGPASVATLGDASPTAENTLDNPDMVTPVNSSFTPDRAKFSYRFSPNSLTILRLPVATK